MRYHARCPEQVANLGSRGIRSLAVARCAGDAETKWEMLGMLTFLDPPRPDTKPTIEQARPAACLGDARCAWCPGAEVLPLLRTPSSPPATPLNHCQALEMGVEFKMITVGGCRPG